MTTDVLDVVYENDHLAGLDVAERRLALRSLLAGTTPESELIETVKRVSDSIDGFGPLTDVMERDEVTDVLVNSPDEVWIDRGAGAEPCDVRFRDEAEVRELVERLLGRAGTRVDASHPTADARLPDGSRINVVLPPIASQHTCISIRRFSKDPLTLEDLSHAGTLTNDQLQLLVDAVTGHRTIAISGGTGCGKTTLMNALLSLIPPSERVVTIEETPELRPGCAHCVSLVTRDTNSEGRGLVTQEDLVRNALRMRPDRIVVGEVRGAEAIAALTAMSVGHEGSMVTVHARSAQGVVPRLVSLALQARTGASETSLRAQVLDCFDLYVHMQRGGSTRRVVEIVPAEQMRA